MNNACVTLVWSASVMMTIVGLLGGCATSLMSREPIRQTVMVQESADAAYVRATRAMARMPGAVPTMANAQARVLSATVNTVVVLNVLVEPVGTAARVEVVGTLLPDKLVLGSFDEVSKYIALLQ